MTAAVYNSLTQGGNPDQILPFSSYFSQCWDGRGEVKDLCHKENSGVQPVFSSEAPAGGGGCGEALIPTAGAQPPLNSQLLSFPEPLAAGGEESDQGHRGTANAGDK